MCESHNIPGGAAHAWERDGYTFESGPSLYSGMAVRPSSNPIGQARRRAAAPALPPVAAADLLAALQTVE